MCKDTFCKNFTKLYTFLVKAVYIPYESLEHNLIFKVSEECTKCFRCQFFSDNNAGWTSTFKVFVFIFICFSACKSYNLCCYICAEFLLTCAVLNYNICTNLAVFKSNKLKRYNVCSLVQ